MIVVGMRSEARERFLTAVVIPTPINYEYRNLMFATLGEEWEDQAFKLFIDYLHVTP